MRTVLALMNRNRKLFFKDKGMLFTSMITPVILIVLYATFLAKVFKDSFTAAIPDMITISDKLINGTVAAQLTASLMAVSCITVMRQLDKEAVRRIFDNILSNAARYSDGDLTISLSADGRIQFSNHSAKLSSVEVEKLFERFYTVETARNSTGIGLSIARLLTERMRGDITAEYKDGQLYIQIAF